MNFSFKSARNSSSRKAFAASRSPIAVAILSSLYYAHGPQTLVRILDIERHLHCFGERLEPVIQHIAPMEEQIAYVVIAPDKTEISIALDCFDFACQHHFLSLIGFEIYGPTRPNPKRAGPMRHNGLVNNCHRPKAPQATRCHSLDAGAVS